MHWDFRKSEGDPCADFTRVQVSKCNAFTNRNLLLLKVTCVWAVFHTSLRCWQNFYWTCEFSVKFWQIFPNVTGPFLLFSPFKSKKTQYFLNMYPALSCPICQCAFSKCFATSTFESCTATDRMIIYTNMRTPNNTDSFEQCLVQICFGLAEAEQTAAANIRRINCERFRLLWAAFPSSWPDSSRHNCLIKDISVMETYISLH